jgi:hypothetical protein
MTSHLFVGLADKTKHFLDCAEPGFSLLADTATANAFLVRFPKAHLFDPLQHHFNPLSALNYRAICDVIDVLLTAFPAGQSTLTKEGVPEVLFEEFARKPKTLAGMFQDTSEDPSYLSAKRMTSRILRSPVLERVFTGSPQFNLSTSEKKWSERSVIARIDRKELGDFDALVLGLFFIAQSKGQLLVPEGGFYLRPLHLSLMSDSRLAVGLRTFAEIEDPKLRQELQLIPDKQGAQCTYDDAIVLAQYAGLMPGQVNHTEFVQSLTVPPIRFDSA